MQGTVIMYIRVEILISITYIPVAECISNGRIAQAIRRCFANFFRIATAEVDIAAVLSLPSRAPLASALQHVINTAVTDGAPAIAIVVQIVTKRQYDTSDATEEKLTQLKIRSSEDILTELFGECHSVRALWCHMT